MKKKVFLEHEIISLLRSFSDSEFKNFGLYLRSPYLSKRKSLVNLYNELIKFHPLYTHIKFNKEFLYKKLFGRRTYKDSTIRDMFSDMIKAAKDFLAHESFLNDSLYPVHVIEQLRLRNQHSLFENQFRKTASEIVNYNGIDPSYFMLRFRLEAERYNEDTTIQKLTTPKRAILLAEEIRNTSFYLIIYSVLEIISIYINLLINANKFRAVKMDRFMLNIINDLALDRTYEHIKGKNRFDYVIEIYNLLLKAFVRRGDWTAYNSYKETLQEHIRKLSHNEAAQHYSHLIRISILGAKTGPHREKFDYELMKIYDTFIEKNYYRLSKSLYLPLSLYRAMIVQGVKMNSPGWLHKIITSATGKLHPDHRDNMKIYAKANYSFASGNYEDALKYINKLSFDLFNFKYDMYVLKARIYYSLDMTEPALELLNAFRQFISNDKMLSDEQKVSHRNFIFYMDKVIKLSLNKSRTDATSFLIKLSKTEKIYNKSWLITKLENLSGNVKKYSKSS